MLNQTVNKIPLTSDFVPLGGEDLLDPRDLHLASLFEGSFGREQKSDLEDTIQTIYQETISKSSNSNPKMSGDIIFSSIPGQYQPFELSATAPIICTINYYKFTKVLHAVCYLWLTREVKIPRDQR